ncbi:MAG: glycosyltransferase family 1 protein [Paracoccaceae bacterium]
MGTITGKPTARCLDVTRLISRVGRGPWTGIDRVELQYFLALAADSIPLYALVRISGRYFVLDPRGAAKILKKICRVSNVAHQVAPWRLNTPTAKRIRLKMAVMALSSRRIPKRRLRSGLAEILPPGTAYVNVGHSNFRIEIVDAIRNIPHSRIATLLHDTIPLDFPEYQREPAVSLFRQRFHLMMQHSDVLICNSEQTKMDAMRHAPDASPGPSICVVHLGVSVAEPVPSELPERIDLKRPYFVAVGTIEPRKNHRVLLDLWGRHYSGPDAPGLFIVGRRGWNNQDVFADLNSNPANVFEMGNLTDGAVSALLKNSQGALFPSHAEGFGLPASEAAMLGVPVICSDLPVFHEVLGDYPIYADPMDMYDWETKTRGLTNKSEQKNNGEFRPRQVGALPTWQEHFNVALTLT